MAPRSYWPCAECVLVAPALGARCPLRCACGAAEVQDICTWPSLNTQPTRQMAAVEDWNRVSESEKASSNTPRIQILDPILAYMWTGMLCSGGLEPHERV